MYMVAKKLAKWGGHNHKLPCSLSALIESINDTNLVGFGRTRQQQLECLLQNLLKKHSNDFKAQLKSELLCYYASLSKDVVNK